MMVTKVTTVLIAIALFFFHVDTFPADQQVLPSVESDILLKVNGIEDVREEYVASLHDLALPRMS